MACVLGWSCRCRWVSHLRCGGDSGFVDCTVSVKYRSRSGRRPPRPNSPCDPRRPTTRLQSTTTRNPRRTQASAGRLCRRSPSSNCSSATPDGRSAPRQHGDVDDSTNPRQHPTRTGWIGCPSSLSFPSGPHAQDGEPLLFPSGVPEQSSLAVPCTPGRNPSSAPGPVLLRTAWRAHSAIARDLPGGVRGTRSGGRTGRSHGLHGCGW